MVAAASKGRGIGRGNFYHISETRLYIYLKIVYFTLNN